MLSILEKKNELIFLCPCWSRKEDGDPATRPATQICEITQLQTQNTKTVYTTRLK